MVLSVSITTPQLLRITGPFLRRPPISRGRPIECTGFHRFVVGGTEYDFKIAANDYHLDPVISQSPLRPFADFTLSQDARSQ
jgi:hypothetical protein